MRWIALLALWTAMPIATTRGQTAADTVVIDSILLAAVVRDLRLGGDHRPPVRVPLRSELSSWSGRLYAHLRGQYPEFVAVESVDSLLSDRPGLTLSVIVRDLQPHQAKAIIIWSRCTSRTGFLNAWTHEFHMTLTKEATGWVNSPHGLSIGDGHC